jgi:FtsZ-interacting cell division protein YlmF
MAGFAGKLRSWFQDTMAAGPGAKGATRYEDSEYYEDDEYEYEDSYYEDEPEEDPGQLQLHSRREERKSRRGTSLRHPLDPQPVGEGGNTIPFAAAKPFAETVIVHPKAVDDAVDIGNHVRSGKLCIVDLSNLGGVEAQRIADYLGGVCQGIDGVTVRVNHSIFTVCPPNHRVVTDYRDREEEVGSAGIFRRMASGS